MTDTTAAHHRVIVIGAGQAGLAVAAHLAKRGIGAVVLERNERVGDNWRSRWDSLRLYNPVSATALPGVAFPAPRGSFATGRQMADYLESYAATLELDVRTGTGVRSLADDPDGGFVVDTDRGTLHADAVVLANGTFNRPTVPPFAGELDASIRQLHSSDYRRPDQLADGPVLVVGASHSGADIAFEAARTGHRTHLSGKPHGQLPFSIESGRGRIAWPIMRFVATRLLTVDTPIGRKMAPRIRAGGAPLLRIRMPDLLEAGVEHHPDRTTGVRDGRPMLADGTVLDVATVVWCTGFRPDWSFLRLGDGVIDEEGWPIQTKGVSPHRGLFFCGVPFQSGFTSMLVLGAGRDGGHVARKIVEQAPWDRPAEHPTPQPA